MSSARKISVAAVAMLTVSLCFNVMAGEVKSTAAVDYTKAPTRFVEVEGVRYAYRTMGVSSTTPPLVLFQHFTGTMDDWDSALIDGLAHERRVIVFDNAGVSASLGTTPDSVAAMAEDAEKFIDALKLKTVDVLGFSLGGCVVQQVLADRPGMVRKAIIAGTSAKGGEGVKDTPAILAESTKVSDETKIPLKQVLFFSRSSLGLAQGGAFLKRINNHTVDRESPVSNETVNAQLKALVAWGDRVPEFQRA
ncbi:alpha/beta fold hydrolase [Pseudomonas gingeri]|uniref:alpha/beta fold hydrolase n=1 Tax=Pseudomonas gingeri TaxID=117681 RepID=UPI001C432B9D|nr:alpha/beta hydrolase [Pseudomonas gingeri]